MTADECLPVGIQEVECRHCGWTEELVFEGHMPIGLTIITTRYRSLCHVAAHHAEEFEAVTGQDPVASVAAYDQELAKLGIHQMFIN